MKINRYKPEVEWLKWLSYEPESFQLVKEDLYAREVSTLSLYELEMVKDFRIQEKMLGLFKQYVDGVITEDIAKEIKYFMKENSIEDLMLSKLSSEEVESASRILRDYEECPSLYWQEEFEYDQDPYVYKTLGMVDSYILHEALKIDADRKNEATKKRAMARIRKEN